VIRDMPIHAKRVAVYVDTRRWRCADCGKTFMEALPAINAKPEMTERLCRWIGQQSLKRAFASIADDTGLDEKTIRNIFRDYVNELEAQFRFETPKWMDIDEIHLIRPRCVISNIHNNHYRQHASEPGPSYPRPLKGALSAGAFPASAVGLWSCVEVLIRPVLVSGAHKARVAPLRPFGPRAAVVSGPDASRPRTAQRTPCEGPARNRGGAGG